MYKNTLVYVHLDDKIKEDSKKNIFGKSLFSFIFPNFGGLNTDLSIDHVCKNTYEK